MANSFFIDDGSLSKRPIRLSPVIKAGAAGTIHRVIGEPGVVVKLYKEARDLPEYEPKIEAMLASPPKLPAFSYNGRTYVQIAWPTARVLGGNEFRGFVMPEVDLQASTELENILQRSVRKRKQLPEMYGARVLLATNLAALMAELHALAHYMVDMKPVNINFYPHAWYMAILDCDGFSINGTRRLPSRQFSDEYIAPEAFGKKPEQLGLEQDLFALAVIIFRLLNNGIHPYQGIDAGNFPTTLQERIFGGLYAYGFRPCHHVTPAASSIHEYFEDSTRTLFDRAFQTKGPRTTAIEWRDHLTALINNKVLVRCRTNSKEHQHFSKGCGLCALERRVASARASAASITVKQPIIQSSGAVLNSLPAASAHAAYAARRLYKPSIKVVLWTAATVIIGAYLFGSKKQSEAPSQLPRSIELSITNAAIGKSIDANGYPLDISSVFEGPTASVAGYVSYIGGRPNMDTVSFSVADSYGKSLSCNPVTIVSVRGSANCKWSSLVSGSYQMSIYVNHQLAKTLPFTVTAGQAWPPESVEPGANQEPLPVSPGSTRESCFMFNGRRVCD